MNRAALEVMVRRPAQVARWCGAKLLTDDLHGRWMQEMLLGQEDMTLLAHRGAYKTTTLACTMAMMLCLFPHRNMLFLRKTEQDVTEVIRLTKRMLEKDAMQYLTTQLWGQPVTALKSDQFSVTTNCYFASTGAAQLVGQGVHGSLTGKHADVILTDDIVNLQDRLSQQEREHTRAIYQELQNIRNPGGRMINLGTPWHAEDAISLMQGVRKYDCYQTGLLTPRKLQRLRQSMAPALFAANYELKLIAQEDTLFQTVPERTEDETLLHGGMAHIDASYGGKDMTALTCLNFLKDGKAVVYGRLYKGHVEEHMEAILAECERLRCAPIWCESNGDKGYLARELRRRGAQVRLYQETTNKYMKIATHLKKWWPKMVLLEGTDPAYVGQIMGYSMQAAHDDAPDSAASLIRAMARN